MSADCEEISRKHATLRRKNIGALSLSCFLSFSNFVLRVSISSAGVVSMTFLHGFSTPFLHAPFFSSTAAVFLVVFPALFSTFRRTCCNERRGGRDLEEFAEYHPSDEQLGARAPQLALRWIPFYRRPAARRSRMSGQLLAWNLLPTAWSGPPVCLPRPWDAFQPWKKYLHMVLVARWASGMTRRAAQRACPPRLRQRQHQSRKLSQSRSPRLCPKRSEPRRTRILRRHDSAP